MAQNFFVGRKDEIQLLREPNWRAKSQLIVIYGRRRVGKTALVKAAFQDHIIWEFDGLEGVSQKEQLRHFLLQLESYTDNIKLRKIKTWQQAFKELYKVLQNRKDIVVFLDEFQWLARMRSSLVSIFKSSWDLNLSRLSTCHFVLCGSVSSFMVKKVIKSRALYGRIDKEIQLGPLNTNDAFEFFRDKRTTEEILKIIMIFGSIPQYLLELNPKLSLIQNLNEYAFSKNGYFVNEYQRLFVSHFGKNTIYKKILSLLSTASLSAKNLAEKIGVKSGGTFTAMLEDLKLAGFIERYSSLNKNQNSHYPYYRISDEYLHFYFKFIEPHLEEIQSGRFTYTQVTAHRDFEQWQGYAFERLCRKNAKYIADYLRFSGIQYKMGSWFTTGRSSKNQTSHGAQIDLLFERGDKILTVCECKWTEKLASKVLIEQFEKKLSRLREDFPNYGIQKVLLLGKNMEVPESIRQYFDEILIASKVFFSNHLNH